MNINKNQYIGIILVIGMLLILYSFYKYRNSNIRENGVQTIGLVNGYLRGTKTGPSLKYVYKVDKDKYEGSTYIGSSEYSNYKNRFYQVQYSSENPGWSELLLNRPVTDTIAIIEAGFSIPRRKGNQFQED